ncbi:FKBP-type peptidyl-prolyl cis-trans isomerase [Microbacterium rhizomatis]|uniref:Peptidyl-prolyl cis-trans isomerase n=1 Tax=Microbacterium rhizomatis TaxID=1631477 RepID=A0A5J5J4Y8_9MICO|nr:FKBP-type peptidyl-prolyl cis-trans isomerase [Microbacterium rhizomatis]KAA9111102.1 FKBP-type peptidyl-prolyl cis-trans isomerase [Microbacterium rhizomatis]
MRIRPIVTLSVIAAATALVLSGCSASSTPDSSASPSATAAADLCAAAAPSGPASESVKVDGAFGTDSAATFSSPLTIDSIQRTVVTEGSGTPIKAGDLVAYGLSAYSADTGEKLGAVGYNPGEVLPAQVSTTSPLGQVLGCATPGTRIVATFPASENSAGEVYVFDLLSVVPNAAWGADQPPVAGMPTVTLDGTGAPTITLPGTAAPTEVQLATLKKGDGPVVASGDQVLVQYTGVKWSDGSVFDSSWTKGAPVAFATTGVVAGFQQALEGATVGSQVLVVIPPAFGYGADATSELKDETLVFVVDILGVQHAAAAQ